MVLVTFTAFDNESLTVSADSPFGTAGNPIVNNSDTPNGTIFTFQSGFPAQTIELDDTNDPTVFQDDDASNHTITDGSGLVANGQNVEAESVIVLRALDGDGNPIGPEIEVIVLSQGGSFSNIWGFGTSQFLEPGTSYVKVSGSNTGTSAYTDFVTCFAEGTPVRMADGCYKRVEKLTPGDRIWTEDNPDCELKHVAVSSGSGDGARAPVSIAAGVFGNTERILVSPQHRLVVHGPEATLMFGVERLLIPAVHLVGMAGVSRAPTEEITYFHLVFDRHRIVDTTGMLSESFYPGAQAVANLDAATRQEIQALFPELSEPAAPSLRAHESRLLYDALSRRTTFSRQSE